MEKIESFQRKHRKNVGRCFKTLGGDYVIITDVPQPYESWDGMHINKTDFPCFVLASKEDLYKIPVLFWDDSAYTEDGFTFGVDPLLRCPPWVEITLEEFEKQFDIRVRLMRERLFQRSIMV